MIQDGLYTLLTNDAAVSALVAARIYPNVAPQKALMPYIVYELINSRHVEVLNGSGGESRASVRFMCWSTSYDTAWAVAEKLRLALQRPPSELAGLTGSETITGVSLIDDGDLYEAPIDAGERGRHAVDVEYAIWHAEAIPA